MYPSMVAPWGMDWVWSLPLIVTTVIVHVVGLMLIFRGFVDVMSGAIIRRRVVPMFVLSMAAVSLLAVLLHGFEGTIWAASYRLLGALPDYRSAMLYSLSAMTTYGHATVYLEARWELMVRRIFERHIAVRSNDRVSVRHDPRGLGLRKARAAQT